MLTIIIIFLLLFGPIRVPAHQAGKGEIDKQVLLDGEPLMDACVTLISATGGIAIPETDDNGWYNFTGLSFGQYTLLVDWNCDGVIDATHKIDLTEENSPWIRINRFFSLPKA